MTNKDGGPAFPHESYDIDADMDTVKPGMSLRDWFAGQALVSMGDWMPLYRVDGTPIEGTKSLCNPSMLRERASWAYHQADAMLAARTNTDTADGEGEGR